MPQTLRVELVQETSESCVTVVKCAVGVTEAGENQRSALSPFRLTDEARQVSLWMMMFADDTVICRVEGKPGEVEV